MDIKDLKGKTVKHIKWGAGTITEVEDTYVMISFDIGEKKFNYPKAFETFLTLDDADAQKEAIEKNEEVKEKEQKEKEEKAKEYEFKMSLRKSAKGHAAERIQAVSRQTILDRGLQVGDAFNTICEIINTCFGENYEGYQRAWYKVDDTYAAWFPKLAIYENGRPHAASEKGWVNILSDDGMMIFETNEINEDYPMEAHKTNPQYFKHRITFSKADGASYRFIGVFAFKEYDKEKGNIYERIEDHLMVNDLQVESTDK